MKLQLLIMLFASVFLGRWLDGGEPAFVVKLAYPYVASLAPATSKIVSNTWDHL
jgi:hypothetical protein